jgi:phage antirepressor YoqD-like protein
MNGIVKHDTVTDNRGIQQLSYINEPNLYRLISHSNLPEAEKFESWIYEEVLPQIRKTGTYGVQKELTRKELAMLIIAAEEEKEKALQIVEEQKLLIEKNAPKVVMADCFLTAKNNHTFETAAKLLNVGSINLTRFLHYSKILFSTKENNNTPYRNYEGKYFVVVDASCRAKDELHNKPQTLVTPEGVEMIRSLIASDWSVWYPNRNRLELSK